MLGVEGELLRREEAAFPNRGESICPFLETLGRVIVMRGEREEELWVAQNSVLCGIILS